MYHSMKLLLNNHRASKKIIYNSLGRVSDIRTREFSTPQMWLGDHSQINLNIIQLNQSLKQNRTITSLLAGEHATITPLGNSGNYSEKIKHPFTPLGIFIISNHKLIISNHKLISLGAMPQSIMMNFFFMESLVGFEPTS